MPEIGKDDESTQVEDSSFYASLNKNHRQWLLMGVVGPPLIVIAWLRATLLDSSSGDAIGAFGLLFCGLATASLAIRTVVAAIDKDGLRIIGAFLGLALVNGLTLWVALGRD
jgi:drug/metabolite transporter superfamily protein YnfA